MVALWCVNCCFHLLFVGLFTFTRHVAGGFALDCLLLCWILFCYLWFCFDFAWVDGLGGFAGGCLGCLLFGWLLVGVALLVGVLCLL